MIIGLLFSAGPKCDRAHRWPIRSGARIGFVASNEPLVGFEFKQRDQAQRLAAEAPKVA